MSPLSYFLRLSSTYDFFDAVRTILVDCGKTFREQAIEFFPKKGLRKIDALILTHHHADAIDGLDDLRGELLSPLSYLIRN